MRMKLNRSAARAARVCAALLVLSYPAFAFAQTALQDGTPQKKEAPKEEPKNDPLQKDDAKKERDKGLRELDPLGTGSSEPAAGSEAEMKELFIKVDKRLKRVSELLFEASTGDAARASEVGASGIDELIRGAEDASSAGAQGIARILEASRSQTEAANEEITRILEIAAQSPQGGGGGQPPPPSSQQNPQQGQTPSGSKREEKGGTPESQGQDQQDQKGSEGQQQQGQEQNGDDPKGGQEQSGKEDDKGNPPPESEKGNRANATGTEDWGDLPVHLQKTFQNGVSDDVPPRYRDWVDSYYKRLNKRSGR